MDRIEMVTVTCPVCDDGEIEIAVSYDGPPPLIPSFGIGDLNPSCGCSHSDLVDMKRYLDRLLQLVMDS